MRESSMGKYSIVKQPKSPHEPLVSHKHTTELYEFFEAHRHIRDRETHSRLQVDLVVHLWKLHGES
ncbi:hypothetical protein RHGRI_036902 [Rhododendron griersonianum]|uniref:Uncharacterized protein n=1 Tax=Rhododendron griersonianum TaxID=479676 RepID=A0AAV6HV78_9ERIC|nr:hypothetical protein RHGRI_036902 [Rhododendron griersonianum]